MERDEPVADPAALSRGDLIPVRHGRAGATWAPLADGRAHFQHGPIDLVIALDGAPAERRAALDAAWQRFDGLLQELVDELPRLRAPVAAADHGVTGPVARRMVGACRPHADAFITPMAAVAGAVAEEILAAMTSAATLERAAVNNGGDIALHLADGATWRLGIVADPTAMAKHGHRLALDGTLVLAAGDRVRGVATSGWRGRSLSLGIADSVTVLAPDAATADAAATMIANAVDVDHPGIVRSRACDVVDDSDLGARRVTRDVPALDEASVAAALDRGAAHARALVNRGIVAGAALLLQGRAHVIGGVLERVLAPAATFRGLP